MININYTSLVSKIWGPGHPVLNNTFEPEENIDTKRQKSTFVLSHPILLQTWEDVRIAIINEMSI